MIQDVHVAKVFICFMLLIIDNCCFCLNLNIVGLQKHPGKTVWVLHNTWKVGEVTEQEPFIVAVLIAV